MADANPGQHPDIASQRDNKLKPFQVARRALIKEWLSGITGVVLVLFMWGHMFFVSSILTGEKNFNLIADIFEYTWLAQITILVIVIVFLFILLPPAVRFPGACVIEKKCLNWEKVSKIPKVTGIKTKRLISASEVILRQPFGFGKYGPA